MLAESPASQSDRSSFDDVVIDPPTNGFAISEEVIDGRVQVISVTGELDVLTAPKFKETIMRALEAGVTQLVIDFNRTTFIDSTTLGVLVGTLKRVRQARGGMALVCTDPAILKLIEITSLHRVFDICASREAAIDRLGSS